MRLLLADDHDLLRDTLTAYLEANGFECIDAATVDEALERINSDGPLDVILLDYKMPGMNGLEGLRRVRAACGTTPVAILSGEVTQMLVDAALKCGASGYFPKTLSARSIVSAISFIVAGEKFVPITQFARGDDINSSKGIAALSLRELQVLKTVCEGKANKEIARELGLRETTIKLHVKTMCRKINARNRTHAAIIARDLQLV